jgi:valine dehydrogenase (NAD+)
MGVFSASDTQDHDGHEQVVFCQDKQSGLRAIIGIYSTALGPALGGTRFYPYESEADAIHDVLALSRGMAYKNALAGLDLGGGKAVIWGDPGRIKNEPLLRGGCFDSRSAVVLHRLRRRYVRAGHGRIARETRFVTGRSVEMVARRPRS